MANQVTPRNPFWDPQSNGLEYVVGEGVPEALGRDQWSAWDKMTLAGRDVPGHVVVFGRRAQRHDMPGVPGQNFARLTNLGYDPTEIDITITLWTGGQQADYEDLLLLVQPKPLPPQPPVVLTQVQITNGVPGPPQQVTLVRKPQPIDVYHPALAIMGVKSIFIHDVGLLVPGPVFGTKIATWRAAEFAPIVAGNPDTFTGSLDSYLKGPPVPQASLPTTRPDLDDTTTAP
jgi:hypothetical protein